MTLRPPRSTLRETNRKGTRKMKTAIRIVAVLMVITWAGTGLAQEAVRETSRRWCGPVGTWFGSNETFGLEFIVTIDPMGGGCFSVVAETVEVAPPWEYSTSWRGMLSKGAYHTYTWTQIAYAGPSQFTDPSAGVPDIAAIRGVLTMLDCDHIEVDFGPTELYAWGQTPFEDDPAATWPPSIARYTRVPTECGNKTE